MFQAGQHLRLEVLGAEFFLAFALRLVREAVAQSCSSRAVAASRSSRSNRARAFSIVTCFCSPVAFSRADTLQHAVEVQVELHDDLVAGRHRGQPLDQEPADAVVAAHVVALALVDVDLHLASGCRVTVRNTSLRDAGSGVLRWMIGAKRYVEPHAQCPSIRGT